MKTKQGFTLIETIMYIALLAFIMGGVLPATYNIIEGSGRLNTNAVIQEEGNFVLRKLDWALSSASGFDSSVPHQLTITRYGGTTVVIKRAGTEVAVSEDGGITFVPLTTDNVTVSSFVFQNIPAVGTAPRGVTATLMLNNATFFTTKYLRK